MHWYDGGKRPAQFAEWGLDAKRWDSGVVFAGDKGLLVSDYGSHQLLPEKDFADFQRPGPTIASRSATTPSGWRPACATTRRAPPATSTTAAR
jgi:hypothetical protein